jgi:hypothetical protein
MLNVYHNHLPVKDQKFIPTTGKTILSPKILRVLVMMFNPTLNNISVISWRPVLFGGNRRKHCDYNCGPLHRCTRIVTLIVVHYTGVLELLL